ncbi:MAG TPA: GatB/YqeY domain-containing protein [Candidatus Saccharimonadales bacterium]|nr:GatB/YqeY domain-containing protein [Candidatus Saccharimonadales bacterium]
MRLKQQLEQDLKTALLAGDKDRARVLRGIKSVILYAEVAKGAREQGLPDEEIIALLSKEAKKRQESADLYAKGGSADRQEAELAEKVIIEAYLPKQLDEAEVLKVIDEIITGLENTGPVAMGQVIGAVKQKTAGAADGAVIARLVKERLQSS